MKCFGEMSSNSRMWCLKTPKLEPRQKNGSICYETRSILREFGPFLPIHATFSGLNSATTSCALVLAGTVAWRHRSRRASIRRSVPDALLACLGGGVGATCRWDIRFRGKWWWWWWWTFFGGMIFGGGWKKNCLGWKTIPHKRWFDIRGMHFHESITGWTSSILIFFFFRKDWSNLMQFHNQLFSPSIFCMPFLHDAWPSSLCGILTRNPPIPLPS